MHRLCKLGTEYLNGLTTNKPAIANPQADSVQVNGWQLNMRSIQMPIGILKDVSGRPTVLLIPWRRSELWPEVLDNCGPHQTDPWRLPELQHQAVSVVSRPWPVGR